MTRLAMSIPHHMQLGRRVRVAAKPAHLDYKAPCTIKSLRYWEGRLDKIDNHITWLKAHFHDKWLERAQFYFQDRQFVLSQIESIYSKVL